MPSALPLPAAQGPVAGLVGRSGRYTGFSVFGAAAGTVRLWSGSHIPAASEAGNVTLLDEINVALGGTASGGGMGGGPQDGVQYNNGIYVELVTGAMPQGTVRVTGPHS